MCAREARDRFARYIGFLSLAIAAGAFVVMVLDHIQEQQQFEAQQSEELAILLDPHVDGPVVITEWDFGSIGRVVQIPWKLSLSNTGGQKLSIIQYSLTAGPGPTFYNGIDGGMYGVDLRPVNLPLMLDPGESRVLVILVGVLVPPPVYEVLSSASDTASMSVSEATRELGRRGLDLYGNRLGYEEFPGGAYLLTIGENNQKVPVFYYRVVTGRGNVFSASASQ